MTNGYGDQPDIEEPVLVVGSRVFKYAKGKIARGRIKTIGPDTVLIDYYDWTERCKTLDIKLEFLDYALIFVTRIDGDIENDYRRPSSPIKLR